MMLSDTIYIQYMKSDRVYTLYMQGILKFNVVTICLNCMFILFYQDLHLITGVYVTLTMLMFLKSKKIARFYMHKYLYIHICVRVYM